MDKLGNLGADGTNLSREENGFNHSLKWWNLVRWLSTIGYLSVGILLMRIEGKEFSLEPFIMILIAINLLNLVYSFWLQDMHQSMFFPIMHNFLDVVVFSLAIIVTGGISSPLIWMYLIPIITSSVTSGKTVGFLACMFSLVGLFMVVPHTQGLGLDEWAFSSSALKNSFIPQITKVISYSCLFFLVYFISSFLSEALRRQNRLLILLNNLVDKKNRDVLRAQEKVTKMEEIATINRLARTFQHELNNPLSIITESAQLLMNERTLSRDALERVRALGDSVTSMKTVLGKLDSLYQPANRKVLESMNLYPSENTVQESVNQSIFD